MKFWDIYYEVVTRSGETSPDGIDYKGICAAFETLSEAIDYADKAGADCVSQIGGAWDEWERCTGCGEWFPSVDLDTRGNCERCAVVDRDRERG